MERRCPRQCIAFSDGDGHPDGQAHAAQRCTTCALSEDCVRIITLIIIIITIIIIIIIIIVITRPV